MRTARLLPVSQSMHSRGDVPAWGGVPAWGMYLPGRGVPAQVLPPPVDRMTDKCKNIAFANFVCGR